MGKQEKATILSEQVRDYIRSGLREPKKATGNPYSPRFLSATPTKANTADAPPCLRAAILNKRDEG